MASPRTSNHKPSSFTSSYRIHEYLMGDLDLPSSVITQSSRWVMCFLVIQFDVDIGPDLKIIRPSIKFDEDDFKTICFSSLPERSGASTQTAQFHTFRFRSSAHANQELYGYSMFNQIPDVTANRGYLQESVVILSQHNFPRLFEKCLSGILEHENFLICPLHQKIPCLDNAIYNIAEWPNPEPSTALEIGFLGSVYNVMIPQNDYTPLVGYTKTKPNEISSSEPIGSWNQLLSYFNDLSELYVLYEHAILGKPLVIYSITPRLCSMLVSNLVDLIRPVPYAERIREYVTIHSYTDEANDGITGITNPIMVNDMDGYVFLLTKVQQQQQQQQQQSQYPQLRASNFANKWAAKLLRGGGSDPSSTSKTDMTGGVDDTGQYKEEVDKLKNRVRISNRQILKSRLLTPDNKFLSTLSSMVDKKNPAVDYAVRFHFATLTSRLISPLSVYLIPSPSSNGLIFNQLEFVNDLSNDESWNEPVEPLKTFDDSGKKLPASHGVWHTLQKMSSRASVFSQQSMGIKFAASSSNSGVVSKQEFYHTVIKSNNFVAWLRSNGVYIDNSSPDLSE